MSDKKLKPESEQSWKTPLSVFARWLIRKRGENAKPTEQSKREFVMDELGISANTAAGLSGKDLDTAVKKARKPKQSGGMIGQSDMTAKKVTVPKAKKKIPQYYKGGGKVKKYYAYGGRVAKYKG